MTLSTTNRITTLTHYGQENIKQESIEYSKIISAENNFIIFGRDKSGKTCLLYKLLLDCMEQFSEKKIFPVYLSLKKYYKQGYTSIRQHIRKEYIFTQKISKRVEDDYHIFILADDFDIERSDINTLFFNDIKSLPRVTFVLTTKPTIRSSIDSEIDGIKFKSLFLNDIGRKQIRDLVAKWEPIENNRKEIVIEKVTAIFKQLNIHFNYWTVSLFLWVFEKTKDVNLHNNFELIDLYIDNLLERSQLALDTKSSMSYENYKDFLADIAYFSYREKGDDSYSVSYSELVTCFEIFQKNNIRIVGDARKILDYLIQRHIIIETDGNKYCFRLNGVFEYFLAHKMKKTPPFLRGIIENPNLFLSFGNELEIYAGAMRNDLSLLEAIYSNTLDAQKKLLEHLPQKTTICNFIKHKASKTAILARAMEKAYKEIIPLTYDQQDAIHDNIEPINDIESSVRKKSVYNIENINAELYERHLFILSRIFRSSDDIMDQKTLKEIFSFIVEQYCKIFHYFLCELSIDNSLLETKTLKKYLEAFSAFAPIISHTFLYEAIGHKNLRTLSINLINELKEESIEKNQYKLFVLYFLIIESNIDEDTDLFDELINIAKSDEILWPILAKTVMLISFKTLNNKTLEQKLRLKIDMILPKLKIKTDKGKINESIKNLKE